MSNRCHRLSFYKSPLGLFYNVIVGALCLLLLACTQSPSEDKTMNFPRIKKLTEPAPIAKQVEHSSTYHWLTLSDPYFWLKDSSYPIVDDQPVLDYVNAENSYFNSWVASHQDLVDTLYDEFVGRLEVNKESVPYIKNGYEYRWQYGANDDYKTWYRRQLPDGKDTLLLNGPTQAAGHEFFNFGELQVSPDNQWLAFTVDTTGDERYQLYLKNLETNEITAMPHNNIMGAVYFSKDSQSIIYTALAKDKWISESVKIHTIGTSSSLDKTLYTEADDAYFLEASPSSDGEYLIINSAQQENNEVWVIAMDDLEGKPSLLKSRNTNFRLSVDHANGMFYIIANDTHVNGRLVKVSDGDIDVANWQTILAGSDEVFFRKFQAFVDFLVIEESVNGVEQILILPYDGDGYRIQFPESIYSVKLIDNKDFNQHHVRLSYSSMVTPSTVFDYSTVEKQLVTRQETEIPSGYDGSLYDTKRLMVPVRDGVLVPVSLVYKKGVEQNGKAPLFLTGYGAYGYSYPVSFSNVRLSLLDRGFVYAIAHVRGGGEMGFQWYLDGKLEKRTNTFNDFVDVARYLAAENYTSEGNISISGASAGGELMGAVVIQAPELWRSVVLNVPFVDVLNTMLDKNLPLTPPEWKEWGNPIENKDDFLLLQSYSPYDNIEAREYPPMLVTGGLNDPRVTYWEPTKWTAKMRATKTDDNLLLLKINMGAGHFANSGRIGGLVDYAERYAFTLTAHGITQ
jgi:oligopeptidase B